MNHWSSSRLLPHYQHWILTGTPQISCCCSVSWRSWSFGSVGLALSHATAVHRGVDILVEQVKALDLGLSSKRVGLPVSSPSPIWGRAFQHCPGLLTQRPIGQLYCAVPGKRRSCFRVRAGIALLSHDLELALPFTTWGQLSRLLR